MGYFTKWGDGAYDFNPNCRRFETVSLLPENRFGFPAGQSGVPPPSGGTPLFL
jgi:hypothetical protein